MGEDLVALLGAVQGLVRPGRRRRAIDWAAGHRPSGWGRWRLALSVHAQQARFIAQEALVGVREPATLRRHVRVEGAEHLAAAAGRRGTMLLGFHVGPPASWLALRVLGHRLTVMREVEHSGRWRRAPWQPYLDPAEFVSVYGADPAARGAQLYRASSVLRAGGTLFLTADGPFGREAFHVALPGGVAVIRSGWLALRRHTGAVIVPLLARRRGRTRIITLYPPLPPLEADPERDRAVCREVITALLQEYVRRFPEQCPCLAFWRNGRPESAH
jgi:hypothetical protein